MRIAILGSVALPVPPPAQGGTEWIAYFQAQGLAKLGHHVILFAAKGSQIGGNYLLIEVGGGDTVVGSNPHPVILGATQSEAWRRTPESDSGLANARQNDEIVESSRKLRLENVYLSQVIQYLIDMKDQYDLIINNMRGEAVFLPFAKAQGKPFVNVMHLPLFDQLAGVFKKYNTHVITISNSQRKEFPDLNYLATVYNCVDTHKYVMLNSFQHLPQIPKSPSSDGILAEARQVRDDSNDDYLLMMGSIARHKNQKGAIEVAQKLGMKLVLAGKINDQKYFDELKPYIDGEIIRWVGEMAFEEKLKLYQNAKVFLFPIVWEEPFGLVMIEAMACGTPVVAFGNGAIPEVVVDGKTGFVIQNNSLDAMVEAVKKIDQIKREDCRNHVIENFSIDKIVKDYEKALSSIK